MARASQQGSITVRPATPADAPDIRRIYEAVRLDPGVFGDLASDDEALSGGARRTILDLGGFVCPPTDDDMRMGLEEGVSVVAVRDGRVVAFSRYATWPDTVAACVRGEFELGDEADDLAALPLVPWSGESSHGEGRVQTRVEWVDLDAARCVLEGAAAGLRGAADGKLAWSIDAAVDRSSRRMGVSRMMSGHLAEAMTAQGSVCLAYRLFELKAVNGRPVLLENAGSKRSYVGATSTHFAVTEEEIRLRDDVTVTVLWNQWLKRWGEASPASP